MWLCVIVPPKVVYLGIASGSVASALEVSSPYLHRITDAVFSGQTLCGQTHSLSVMMGVSCQLIDLACLTSLKIDAAQLF